MRHSPSRPSRVYLDYAASTPVAPEVFRAMQPYFSEKFGNPGSLHSFGQEALSAVDRARETIARVFGAKFREIIFTGSATEANNLALRGAIKILAKKVLAKNGGGAQPRLIVSAVEHESVLETARALKKEGVEVIELPVDKNGIVKLNALAVALANRPALVSIMYANNETGVIQPIEKISKIVHEAGSLLHVDAAQAFQFLNCDVDALGADLLTLSAHKIYGPKGIGALYVRAQNNSSSSQNSRNRNAKISILNPILTGGGQEFGLRSGTENVPLIAGFAAAVEYIEKDKEKHARRIEVLREKLFREIKKMYPRAELNGGRDGKGGKDYLPNIANIWLPGKSAEDLLIRLDLAGVAVSAGSACTARSSQPSYVLRAMGFSDARARQSLRFSLGRPTTEAEIKAFLVIFRSFLR